MVITNQTAVPMVNDAGQQSNSSALVGTAANDELYGDDSANTLMGGEGDDTLDGGPGNDIYAFNRGDGRDRVIDFDQVWGNVDTIRFGAGIAPSDISFARSQRDLVLTLNGATDQITIRDWGFGEASQIERIEFADETVWDSATLQELLEALAIEGTDADDTLQGWSGNEFLIGGAGADRLDGGNGDDTYLFNPGDGQDTISDFNDSWLDTNIDTIRFGAGISAQEVTFALDGADLRIDIGGGDDHLTVEGWRYSPLLQVERIEFADGTVWDAATIAQRIASLPITGTAGDDELAGSAADDTLQGKAGNDLLEGGAGDDTYLFARGDGKDTLLDVDYSEDNLDILKLDEAILPGDIAVTRRGDDAVLSLGETDDAVTLQLWNAGAPFQIERIEFADGSHWSGAQLQQMLLNAPMVGTDGGERMFAWYGMDEHMQGLGGTDLLFAGVANDLIDGGTGNDLIDADDGDDILRGGEGNDMLIGGAGNDTLETGTGMNILAFNAGHGHDTVRAGTGAGNALSLGLGIAYADLFLAKTGDDLVLITGMGARIVFAGWYAAGGGPSVSMLQVVLEGGSDYQPESDSALHNRKVELFSFASLVQAFDQARALDPGLAPWAVESYLVDAYVGGSDDSAIGASLAYLYATSGYLRNIGVIPVQMLLENEGFGETSQVLLPIGDFGGGPI